MAGTIAQKMMFMSGTTRERYASLQSGASDIFRIAG
jgi:hypothetical protein